MNPFDPLTEEELEWLDEVLLVRIDEDAVTEGIDEGILDVSELDGFLTAIVSGPVTLGPSHWMPAMWGEFEPVWNSVEDYQLFMSLLLRHSNSIASMLMDAPEAFEPLFYERKLEDRTIVVVDEWCEGYERGVRLTGDEWNEGGPEIADLLAPIRSFTEVTGWRAHDLADSREVDRLRDSIAPNVRAIHARWLAMRSDTQSPERRSRPRVGRNDPCPCGSGRKYKRCCLQ
jgi:uncharacterized protein